MPIVVAEVAAPIASWRPPEALTYHPTLPLPPYTAQVGVLGAGLGLGLRDTYKFITDNSLRLGVGGWHGGRARDLWKHQKLSGDEVKSDILLREHWIDTRLAFVIEVPDAAMAERVVRGFAQPVYPLTAGTSDALAILLSVRILDGPPVETHRLQHTLVYGEINARYALYAEIDTQPLTQTFQAPTVENLPTGFSFDEYGNRTRAGRSRVTFVGDLIALAKEAEPVVGYRVVPVSRLFRDERSRWRADEWIIPVHRYH